MSADLSVAWFASRFTELKGRGKELHAFCPLHDEDTPSFFVNPEKNVWNCKGCGEGGGVVKLAQLLWSCSAEDAMGRLVEMVVGAKLEALASPKLSGGSQPAAPFADEDREWIEVVWRLLQKVEAADGKGEAYIRGRGIRPREIGFWPEGWNASYLSPPRGSRERLFRATGEPHLGGRVVVLLTDLLGRPAGFSGRAIVSGAKRKYMHLYDPGVSHPQEVAPAFGESPGTVVFVEGWLDAMAGAGDCFGSVRFQSCNGSQLDRTSTIAQAQGCGLVLGMFDADQAGDSAFEQLKKIIPSVVRVNIEPKEANDVAGMVASCPGSVRLAVHDAEDRAEETAENLREVRQLMRSA